MERISSDKLALASSTKISPHSRQQQDSAVKAEVMKTATMMNREISAPELNEWAELLSKCSLQQVKAAFAEQMRSSRFWPTPAEILDRIERMKPPVSTRIDYTKPPACAQCNDLKFIYVPQGQSNVTAVRPCPGCRKVSA